MRECNLCHRTPQLISIMEPDHAQEALLGMHVQPSFVLPRAPVEAEIRTSEASKPALVLRTGALTGHVTGYRY